MFIFLAPLTFVTLHITIVRNYRSHIFRMFHCQLADKSILTTINRDELAHFLTTTVFPDYFPAFSWASNHSFGQRIIF